MENKIKRKLMVLIGLVFILVGTIILALPLFSKNQISETSQAIVEKLTTQTDPKKLEKNLKNPTTFKFDEVKSIGLTETLEALKGIHPNVDQLIGQLVIPSIDINLPVFNGLNNVNLLAGVSTMKPNQVMGQANFTIAGHYVTGGNYLFTNLVDIKEKAIVRLTNKQEIFEYQIFKVMKAPSTALYLLDDQQATKHGKPIITLMSCYYSGNHDVRWFALGELVKTTPYSKEAMEAK